MGVGERGRSRSGDLMKEGVGRRVRGEGETQGC